MSGVIDKVKAKVDQVMHKDKTHDDPTGPHSSHAANTADPRVDSDRVGTAGNTAGAGGVGGFAGDHHSSGVSTGLGTSGTHGTTHNTTHGTGLGSSTTGTTHSSDPTGPHNSHALNKADPRVDSDRLGTAGNTAGAGGVGAGQYTESHGSTGLGSSTTGTHGTTHGTGIGSSTHGTGLGSSTTHGTGLGSSTTHGTGIGSSTHGTGLGSSTTHGSDPTGPHNSHALNKADPRVDSDRLGTAGNTAGAGGIGAGQYTESHGSGLTGHSTTGQGFGSSTTGAGAYNTTGSGVTGHSTTGGLGHSDPTGPHSSHAANAADPRVGGGVGSTGIGGTGHHTSTTGEHAAIPSHSEGGYTNQNDLPKALVEPQSHAVPHSSIRDDHQHASGHHGTSDVHGKPSMMDKLNPKKDADHDGKTGIMD